MTWAAETPSASASIRRGMPIAAAGSAIIRASWPPPITARVGASTPETLRGVVLGLEPQSLAADGGDQAWVPAVVAELAAYPAEVDVDGLRRGPERRVPHLAHQLVAAHD